MMQQRIQSALQTIETNKSVKILYACESGSRAWGFPSADSDYDVRFIYLHPRDWYLSINVEHKRDVIERPIDDLLDVNGWDARKALHLFYKSNPPLLEWLGSPTVYWEQSTFARQLRELRPIYYNPVASMYHYLHMAQRNYREYLKGERVWLKKYFYVLRPILAANWIERDYGVVPTEFDVLVERIVDDPALKQQIALLVAQKKAGEELKYGPRIPEIGDYVQSELARLGDKQFERQVKRHAIEPLNELFRAVLAEVWGD